MAGNFIGTVLGKLLADYSFGTDSAAEYIDHFIALFGDVFDFLFQFIFIDMFSFLIERGESVFNILYSHIYNNINTGEFISAIIGMLIFMPILRLVINLLRG